MGSGTKLAKRLKRGDPSINRQDKISKQHDIDYSHAKNLKDEWDDQSHWQVTRQQNADWKDCEKNHASKEKVKIVNNIVGSVLPYCNVRAKKIDINSIKILKLC